MSGRFAGQGAIVTGGASGIGLGIAQRLAADGATVSLWDRDGAALERAAARFGSIHISEVDIVDPLAVEASMAKTIRALDGVHIFVACAGITGCNAPLWEYPIADWRRVMQVNLDGLFYCNRAVIPHFLRQNYGRIVNIASISGKEGNPNASAYSASKAGVIGLTKSLGKELAETDIRVNCVTPGAVRTPLFDQMTESHIQFMLSKIPMRRFGTVEEIAMLTCWLASKECSFSTGAVFDISGGRATY